MTKNTTSSIAIALLACAALFHVPATAASRATDAAENLKVTVKYTGKGEIDASHKLWVGCSILRTLAPAQSR